MEDIDTLPLYYRSRPLGWSEACSAWGAAVGCVASPPFAEIWAAVAPMMAEPAQLSELHALSERIAALAEAHVDVRPDFGAKSPEATDTGLRWRSSVLTELERVDELSPYWRINIYGEHVERAEAAKAAIVQAKAAAAQSLRNARRENAAARAIRSATPTAEPVAAPAEPGYLEFQRGRR